MSHYAFRGLCELSLEVVDVIEDKNLLLVKGAVPGHKNILLKIKKALKKPAAQK